MAPAIMVKQVLGIGSTKGHLTGWTKSSTSARRMPTLRQAITASIKIHDAHVHGRPRQDRITVRGATATKLNPRPKRSVIMAGEIEHGGALLGTHIQAPFAAP
jgi:hypothetical protein